MWFSQYPVIEKIIFDNLVVDEVFWLFNLTIVFEKIFCVLGLRSFQFENVLLFSG